MALADTKEAIAWLAQFKKSDRSHATDLINAILQVAYHDFMNELKLLIRARSKEAGRPIALYAEREVRTRLGVPHRLFKESERKPRRAFGSSIQPVSPVRAYAPEVGSEGLVAQMITELCREDPKMFLNHPGPDRIRKHNVRSFFLITDVIGSGERAWKYLEAAWRVHSVCSWHSLKLLKFEVLAYSATESGKKRVSKHPCEPAVYDVQPCPTIDTSFPRYVAERMKELCVKYDPIDHDPIESLGHFGTGALLAFAHGAPNNTPRILYKKGKAWKPLFPSRVPEAFRADFRRDKSLRAVVAKMNRMRQTRLSKSLYLKAAHPDARILMLVLASLTRGPRLDEALSGKTGLTTAEVRRLVDDAHSFKWIDDNRRVTDEGYRQLEYAKSWRPTKSPLVFDVNEPYYPQLLRAPRSSS
jgi:hypothetical protein